MMWSNHPAGVALLLKNHQALLAGGVPEENDFWNWNDMDGLETFNPATNTFDLADLQGAHYPLLDPTHFMGDFAGTATAMLDDGRVLFLGGWFTFHDYLFPDISGSAALWDPAFPTAAQSVTPLLARANATATKLADGRILITGGEVNANAQWRGGLDAFWSCFATATAEIFDPVSGTFTATGSLNQSRSGHAAILLPTGQVLIVGGRAYVGNGVTKYPNTSELFDPDTGTFSVMDHLDYGLEEPRLALQGDGGVFVAGTVQGYVAPAMAQAQGMKFGFAANLAGTSLLMNGGVLLASVANPTDFQTATTINQGVERYLDQSTQEKSMPAGMTWNFRAEVPILSSRSTLVRSFFNANETWKPGQVYGIEAQLVLKYANGTTQTVYPIGTQDIPIPGMSGVTFKGLKVTPGTVVPPGKEAQGGAPATLFFNNTVLNAAGGLTGQVVGAEIHVGPRYVMINPTTNAISSNLITTKVKTESCAFTVTHSPMVTINIVPFSYKVSGEDTPRQIDFNAVKDILKARILTYLPMSSDSIQVVQSMLTMGTWDEAVKGSLNAVGTFDKKLMFDYTNLFGTSATNT